MCCFRCWPWCCHRYCCCLHRHTPSKYVSKMDINNWKISSANARYILSELHHSNRLPFSIAPVQPHSIYKLILLIHLNLNLSRIQSITTPPPPPPEEVMLRPRTFTDSLHRLHMSDSIVTYISDSLQIFDSLHIISDSSYNFCRTRYIYHTPYTLHIYRTHPIYVGLVTYMYDMSYIGHYIITDTAKCQSKGQITSTDSLHIVCRTRYIYFGLITCIYLTDHICRTRYIYAGLDT